MKKTIVLLTKLFLCFLLFSMFGCDNNAPKIKTTGSWQRLGAPIGIEAKEGKLFFNKNGQVEVVYRDVSTNIPDVGWDAPSVLPRIEMTIFQKGQWFKVPKELGNGVVYNPIPFTTDNNKLRILFLDGSCCNVLESKDFSASSLSY